MLSLLLLGFLIRFPDLQHCKCKEVLTESQTEDANELRLVLTS